jgi:hypothetical protein
MQDGKQGGITPFQAKGGNHTNLLHVAAINEEQKNWPTVCASEVRQGFQDRSRGMKGSQESLTTVVVKDAAMWPTPQAQDTQRTPEAYAAAREKRGGKMFLSLNIAAQLHGQAAPANPSTDGSRQGLSEQSQRNWQTFAHGTHNRGETPHRQVVKALVNGEKAQTQCLTVDQVFAEEIKGTSRPESLWPTPEGMAGGKTSRGGSRKDELLLSGMVKLWPTPDTQTGPHGARGVSTNPNHQSAKSLEATARTWATPIQGDSHLASTPEVAQKRIEEGKVTLSRQNPGKLNPRWVETLMGLPVGWVMPSCASPVTIEPTNFASSATESCLQQPSEHSELFGRNSND